MELKRVPILTKLTIILASFFMMADVFTIAPIMAELANAFPNASISVIGLCYTISQITIIPVAFFCGRLSTIFRKKTLMIVGAVLIAIGGGLGGLYLNITYILIMRALEGVGAGLCITLAPAIIAELFPDDREMTRMNGIFGAVGALYGSVISVISGKLAITFSWQSSYYIFLFSLLLLIMIIAFIPNTPPEKVEEKAEKPTMNKSTWLWGCGVFLFAILTNGVFMLAAGYLSETGTGAADTAGILTSLMTIGSFIGGLVLVWIVTNMNKFVVFVCYLLLSVGIVVIMLVDNAMLIYVGGFIWGLGYGIFFPYIFARATLLASPNSETHTLSVTNSFYYLGMGLTAFFIEFVGKIFNDPSAVASFRFMAAAYGVFTIFYLVKGMVDSKKNQANISC